MSQLIRLGAWRFSFALCLALAFFATNEASGKSVYVWTDDQGVRHIGDNPPAGVKAEPFGASKPAEQGGDSSAKKPVELFVTDWCPYCKKAAAYLKSKGKSFKEYNIDHDSAAARRMRELTSNRGVPFALICGQQLTGFTPANYDKALSKCP